MTTQIRKIGSSYGVILPKQILDQLNLAEGDALEISKTTKGIEMSPFDPNFARAMEAYSRVSRRYRNALRELAK